MSGYPRPFSPATRADKQEVTTTDLGGGSPQTFSARRPTTASFPLMLSDGHSYSITVAACQAATCTLGGSGTLETTGTTRIDATPPSGTVQINDGAVATNNRNVTLNLEATDPLIGGAPGTSSGVTQSATDIDGDGTIPCLLVGPTADSSGCAVPFAPATPATLPAGDGVKKVGVQFGDGARVNTSPCPPMFVCATLLGSFIEGNKSAIATDTILLDTGEADRGREAGPHNRQSRGPGELRREPLGGPGLRGHVRHRPADRGVAVEGRHPDTTGAKVSHVFNQSRHVRRRDAREGPAGNTSDARSFTVTVNGPGGSGASGGSISGLTARRPSSSTG